jgi:hypothetical protein
MYLLLTRVVNRILVSGEIVRLGEHGVDGAMQSSDCLKRNWLVWYFVASLMVIRVCVSHCIYLEGRQRKRS